MQADGAKRRLQAANETLDYFDRLRTDSSLVQSIQGSNESNVFVVTDTAGDSYRLADISGFLPFSNGRRLRPTVENEAIASLLAIYHFNNPETSPILNAQELEGCNVRLTTEFFDTQFSPINSTRRFTDVLLRNHSLDNPLPAAVVGAYRSATTSPLAILTGVNNIPQVSYASTSTDFDVKEQYPYFGRTVPSTLGEARVAVRYFKDLGASHVGILFVTDAYGSALQKAFQDAAAEVEIVTSSVAFSYSASANGVEIENAVASLANTSFRYFYAICFDSHFEPIMTAADERHMTGKDFLWIFPGLDQGGFQSFAKFPPGSALASVTQGIGLLMPTGGFLPVVLKPDEQVEVPLEDPPTTGYQKLRTAWREALSNPEFDAYVRSKLPESLVNISGFDPTAIFGPEPTQWSSIMYDAVTALGISMCRAGAETEFIQGPSIFEYFRNLTFDGASGTVVIDPETGTRNYTSFTYAIWNVQNYDKLDDQGRVQFQLAPTNYHQDGEWKAVSGIPFIYGDNSTEVPEALPPVNMDMNYIGNAGIIVGYVLMAIIMLFGLAAFVWLCWFHSNKVVISSQPLFLLMVCIGAFVMAATIIPLSLQEPISESGLDAACMSGPWLYVVGSVITFSPLFAKTRGIHNAYKNPQLDFIHVTSLDIFITLGVILGLNLAVLIPWTIIAPLEWTRTLRDSTDTFGRPVESYGACTNENAIPFVVVVLILNVGVLMLANWWAYMSRNIETEYHESRYIGISMASVLQAWCMGVPILIVVWDNPSAKFFVEAGIVFVTALAVLLLIFIPKVLAIRSERIQKAQEEKRGAYNNFQARAKSKQAFDDDSDELAVENAAAAHVSNGAAKEDCYPKKSSSTAEATASSEFTKPPPQDAAEADGAATAASVAAVGVAVVGLTAANSNDEADSSSPNRRNSFRSSISARLLHGGAMKSDENTEGVGGIKILHNPRSSRNEEKCGAEEVSREQLASLEDNEEIDDEHFDENESMAVDDEDEADVEETNIQQDVMGSDVEGISEKDTPADDEVETRDASVAEEKKDEHQVNDAATIGDGGNNEEETLSEQSKE
eukprot:CAMPEP_0202485260 /NCGR_PEP_ID=MMETSP1361-20130828/4139_1 /ASSEMBLY_ACC=CAM_ASM_000849 /TAXON_ID=210615 /ORGANISM="Staurosira complex sp., Strain CCMP2646" /LENGTH=1067 /DNA_ID=CAMNT_0049114115 /DNA_START=47 /DNA_END=3250 /DNA_ORIENTATION=+